MRDRYSSDVETAARLAYDDDPRYDERPLRAELAAEEDRAPADLYRGVCGGCGERVSASGPDGSCLWRGAAWHPSCREADKAAVPMPLFENPSPVPAPPHAACRAPDRVCPSRDACRSYGACTHGGKRTP